MNKRANSKCGKPAGSYCSVHNPEPKYVREAHSSVSSQLPSTPLTQSPSNQSSLTFAQRLQSNPAQPIASFQKPGQVRKLASNVPYNLKKHMDTNCDYADEKFGADSDERYALMHYARLGSGAAFSEMFWETREQYKYDMNAPAWRDEVDTYGVTSREELVSYLTSLDSALENRSAEHRIVYHGMKWEHVQRQMKSIIGNAPTPDDYTGWKQALQNTYQKGRIIDFPGYLSTSQSAVLSGDWAMKDLEPGSPYGGVVFELKTNAGVDITGLTNSRYPYATEREVLLPRETRFKVVDIDIYPSNYKTESGIEQPNPQEGKVYPQESEDYNFLSAVIQVVEVDKNGKPILNFNEKHVPSQRVEDAVPPLTSEQKKEFSKYKKQQRLDRIKRFFPF